MPVPKTFPRLRNYQPGGFGFLAGPKKISAPFASPKRAGNGAFF